MTCPECQTKKDRTFAGLCFACAEEMMTAGRHLRWLDAHATRATKTQDGWTVYWRQRGIVRQADATGLAEAIQLARQEWDAIEDAETIGY